MEELSPELEKLLLRGHERIAKNSPQPERNDEFERSRIIARKWRNLVGEARFDIPPPLHRYINWLMPTHWVESPKPHKINVHDFKIEIPGFKTIHVIYKSYQGGEWYFHQFEILESATPVSSTRYYDLPTFLVIAQELKRPRKQQIKIEELEGGLADNAKVVKLVEEKSLPPIRAKGYVLTEADFLNNPDVDFDRASDDGMPIYA